MSSLYTYIATVNSDVDKFNEYSKINYEALATRGERCDDMMSSLLKGYLTAGEKESVTYIQHQKNKYEDRDNIDKDKFMMLALKKYKICAPMTSG